MSAFSAGSLTLPPLPGLPTIALTSIQTPVIAQGGSGMHVTVRLGIDRAVANSVGAPKFKLGIQILLALTLRANLDQVYAVQLMQVVFNGRRAAGQAVESADLQFTVCNEVPCRAAVPPQNAVDLYEIAKIDAKAVSATTRQPRALSISEVRAALPTGTELQGNLTGLPHLHLRVEGVLQTRLSVLPGKPAGTLSYYIPITVLQHEFDTKPGESKAVYQWLMAEALAVHVYQISDVVFTHDTGVLGRRGHALAVMAGKMDQHLCPGICTGPTSTDDDDTSLWVGVSLGCVAVLSGIIAVICIVKNGKKEGKTEGSKNVEGPYGHEDDDIKEKPDIEV
eukprot:Hpha_TRINITY_DN13849_c0_g3::TRINITY_DN13849_c0_g3_i2::g.69850::m.69850